ARATAEGDAMANADISYDPVGRYADRRRRSARTVPTGLWFLLGSIAVQNLGQRKARTLLLVAAVAICSGAVFTGAVLMRSIDVGFTRLGADLLVVPEGTLTNITAALLTAEPTDLTLDSAIVHRIASLKGIRRTAPQLVFRTDLSGYGGRDEAVDMIAFDPA